MGPFALMALMSAAGAAKSELIDRPAANKQRKLQAATAKYSPWTGLRPQAVKEADPFGNALQYGATGASMGMAMENSDKQNQLMDAMKDNYTKQGAAAGGTPWSDNSYDPRNPWASLRGVV